MDEFTEKHLDNWIYFNVRANEADDTRRLIREFVKKHSYFIANHPNILDPNRDSRSWQEILDLAKREVSM